MPRDSSPRPSAAALRRRASSPVTALTAFSALVAVSVAVSSGISPGAGEGRGSAFGTPSAAAEQAEPTDGRWTLLASGQQQPRPAAGPLREARSVSPVRDGGAGDGSWREGAGRGDGGRDAVSTVRPGRQAPKLYAGELPVNTIIAPTAPGAVLSGGEFGWRIAPDRGGREFHNGTDVSAAAGLPVVSALDGEVTDVFWDVWGGNRVEVTHADGVRTTYNHLEDVQVRVGDRLAASEQLGSVGATGTRVTGPHLHFETWVDGQAVDPQSFDWVDGMRVIPASRSKYSLEVPVPDAGDDERASEEPRDSAAPTPEAEQRAAAAEKAEADEKAATKRAAEQRAAEQRAAEQASAAKKAAADQQAAAKKSAEQKAAEQKVPAAKKVAGGKAVDGGTADRAAGRETVATKGSEQQAVERAAAEKAAADKAAAAERAAAEKAAADKAAAAERAAAERAAAERIVAERAAAERLAAEKAAAEKAAADKAAAERAAAERAAAEKAAADKTQQPVETGTGLERGVARVVADAVRDTDGDGTVDVDDPDIDNDGIGNEEDDDVDGDGVPNQDDPDLDGDGLRNDEDPDQDGDGLPDDGDPEPKRPARTAARTPAAGATPSGTTGNGGAVERTGPAQAPVDEAAGVPAP